MTDEQMTIVRRASGCLLEFVSCVRLDGVKGRQKKLMKISMSRADEAIESTVQTKYENMRFEEQMRTGPRIATPYFSELVLVYGQMGPSRKQGCNENREVVFIVTYQS